MGVPSPLKTQIHGRKPTKFKETSVRLLLQRIGQKIEGINIKGQEPKPTRTCHTFSRLLPLIAWHC